MRARYCPSCGGVLQMQRHHPGEPERQVCGQCGRIHFRNAKPTGSALIVRDGRVLLVQRAIEPARGAWDIPGGFLEEDEHPEAGAIRELREETGLSITLTGLLGIYLDTYGPPDEPDTTLNIIYLAMAPHGDPQPADDAAGFGWFLPNEIPDNLAFVHMHAALADWQRYVTAL